MGHVTAAEVENLAAELDDLKRRFDAQLARALDEIERLRAENKELRVKLAPDTGRGKEPHTAATPVREWW